ncbi:MAG: hypothetical protein KKF06_04195 [Candidatus Margulisbacteria bacterium]|nr:hypothetical protein [Candidatus Margulisiibacteriota bacterium]MBU1867813.1 hypothetical protein [Candidatus Margulisiibacteriota bacterium]
MSRKGKAQKKVVDELKNQLMIQAERLGIKAEYTSAWFLEQETLAYGQVLSELYAERSNLEYEMNMLGSDKKDLLIKLERLHSYIRKAEGLREKTAKDFERLIDKGYKITENGRKLSFLDKTEVKSMV